MKNPMLRGNPAPTGFAASVSGWLRTYVYQQRSVGGGVTTNQRVRLDLLDSCASLPIGVGDDDPRLRTLAMAPHAARDYAPPATEHPPTDGARRDRGFNDVADETLRSGGLPTDVADIVRLSSSGVLRRDDSQDRADVFTEAVPRARIAVAWS